jgi:hypothetical protein
MPASFAIAPTRSRADPIALAGVDEDPRAPRGLGGHRGGGGSLLRTLALEEPERGARHLGTVELRQKRFDCQQLARGHAPFERAPQLVAQLLLARARAGGGTGEGKGREHAGTAERAQRELLAGSDERDDHGAALGKVAQHAGVRRELEEHVERSAGNRLAARENQG